MPVPRRPSIDLFMPYASKVVWAGSRYIDDEPTITDVDDDHSDTQVKIWRVSPKTVVCDKTYGSATTGGSIIAPDLLATLTAGELYRVRVRYENASGWSPWSVNTYERVPKGSTFEALSVNAEPEVFATPLSILPDFVITLSRKISLREWVFDTKHIARRLGQEHQRVDVRFEWLVNGDDRSALVGFLDARIAGATSFTLNLADGVTAAGRAWLIRRGSKTVEQVAPNVWSVTCEVIERGSVEGEG